MVRVNSNALLISPNRLVKKYIWINATIFIVNKKIYGLIPGIWQLIYYFDLTKI